MSNDIIQAGLIFGVFFLVSVFLDLALRKVSKHYDASASESFRLLSNSQRGILIFIGLVLGLSKLGFDVSALVAGLGLTGFALGFALKDAISNLVAGIMIVIYKPIELGNIIEVSSTKGEVIDINLRYITIESEGVTNLIPNSLILSNKVAIYKEDR